MASIALFSWPLVALVLYGFLGATRGLIWSLLIGYLFLPEAIKFDLPGLPSYDKYAAIAVSCTIGLLWGRTSDPYASQKDNRETDVAFKGTILFLVALLLISPAFTILTNRAPIYFPENFLRGMGPRDYVAIVSDHLVLLMPFFAARTLLSGSKQQYEFLKVLVIMGIVYSLIALLERRLSPFLHTSVYGYFQHSWVQHIRNDGFRPIGFLPHGLELGFFLFSATVGATALSFAKDFQSNRRALFLAAAWLMLILLFSRNLGAAFLGLVFVPALLFAGRKIQILIMTGIAVLIITLPGLQRLELVPNKAAINLASMVSEERAASLAYRVNNEEVFLEKAYQKPLFGWGIWGRSRIYDDQGRDRLIIDGHWIVIFGVSGWIGYFAYFGVMTLPLLSLWRSRRKREIGPIQLGLGAILAGNLLYMIPNGSSGPFTWLIIGMISSSIQWRQSNLREEDSVQIITSRHTYTYSRF